MNLITADVETYYAKDYTLKKSALCNLSTTEYIRDPRFHAQCLSLKIDDGPITHYPHDDIPEALAQINWGTAKLLAHHTHFEALILNEHYDIKPAYHADTLSMSRSIFQTGIDHDLDTVAKHLGYAGKLQGILEQFKGIRELTPEQFAIQAPYCDNDVEQTWLIYQRMLPWFPQEELDLIDLTIRLYSQPVLELDAPRCLRARQEELDEQARLIAETGYTKEQLRSAEQFANALRAIGIEPPTKISLRTKKEAYAFAKNDPGFQDLRNSPDPRLHTLLDARIACTSTNTLTRADRLLSITDHGTKNFPVYLKYWGAHTPRWSGGDKTNAQNFKRKSELRRSIKAPQDHVLVVIDASQIEARVLAELADNQPLLEAFRQKRDIYSEFASIAYGRTIDRKRIEIVDGIETYPEFIEGFVGKTCILGLGFQMAWRKLRATLAAGAMGGPRVFITEEQAQRFVHIFRTGNPQYPELWKLLQDMLGVLANPKGDTTYKYLRFTHERVWLPNGMSLYYPGIHFDDNGNWWYRKGNGWTKIYGGLLTENIVQSLARIIVAWQMNIIAKRYRIALMTHDEIVAMIRLQQATEGFDFMFKTMCTAPNWCPNIPLDAEGGFAQEYSK